MYKKMREPPVAVPASFEAGNYGLLNYGNVYGLFAFRAVADLEFDLLMFVERFETLGRNAGEMYENFLSALLGNESVAFFAIEPFYSTFHKK